MSKKEEKKSVLEWIATFIVDKRNAFFFTFIGLAAFCIFASGWVEVNNDLTSYLPEHTETRRGLAAMEDEFTTFGSARVMVDNISYEKALELQKKIEGIDGVKSVDFDDSEKHYASAAALFNVTFDGEAADEVSTSAMNQVRDTLSEYDTYISSDVGANDSETLADEMKIVMLIAVVIILAVLLFTSHTYMEIPVLLLTFGAAGLLNMGTNFLLGEISFVSNSIAVVLQLALAIDYAIILCHRYTEERLHLEAREAAITALSKAIPEIAGSSLTTISGLAAMMLMQFRIGYDMGLVLIKAIFMSLLSVFTLMPGLLVLFSKGIDKTHHKSFVPKINLVGKFAVRTRFIVPPLFLILLIGAFIFSNHCPYVYGYSTLSTTTKNETQLQEEKINAQFGKTNLMALLVPSGDYTKEGQIIRKIEKMDGIDSVTGLANIEAMDEYVLTDMLTPRQFAELTDLDIEVSRLLYSAYAAEHEKYGKIVSGIDHYGIPLIDLFMFLYDQKQDGYVNLEGELNDKINDLHTQLFDAERQLKGEHYSRILMELSLPEESDETFALIDQIREEARAVYGDDILLVGESTKDRDLAASFGNDNLLISILSAVFVVIVLLFTFQSAGLPVLLILVIQGSVWTNFSFPTLQHSNIFFMSYLVVSAIQMGANIDYAIVITSRYTALKKEMPIKQAMMEALNQAFPTIVTSGLMLASAGILIGQMSSDPAISSIGTCLGRGTIISIIFVMAILPQILLLGDVIIEHTSFALRRPSRIQVQSGTMRITGRVRGYVSGIIDAEVQGVLHGDIHAAIEAGDLEQIKKKLADGNSEEVEEDASERI